MHKHVTLCALLHALARKDRGFFYLETHAGRGSYDLASSAEGRASAPGIERVIAASGPHPELAAYARTVTSWRAHTGRPDAYPGSPLIAAMRLRPQDRAELIELLPDEASALERAVSAWPRARVETGDGFERLKAFLPPRERRGLTLIDPPYEQTREDYARAGAAISEALRRFATGVLALWYPIKDARDTAAWLATLRSRIGRETLTSELWLHPCDSRAALNGSGVLVVNPPYGFAERVRVWLPELHVLLDSAGTGGCRACLHPCAPRMRMDVNRPYTRADGKHPMNASPERASPVRVGAHADEYGVIGHPVAHSWSPFIHELFARETHQALVYRPHDVVPERFREYVLDFASRGGRGLNVTVPHKAAAAALADELTARAERAGAVNTLVFDRGRIRGDNTDGAGLVTDLREHLALHLGGARILLAGAGGAARGVLGPLLELGPALVVIANRTSERARALAGEFASLGGVRGCAFGELPRAAFDLILNATAASLSGEVPAIPHAAVGPTTVCYDMVYSKSDTPFVLWARDQGCRRAVQGWGMLVEQAAESFAIWRGVRPSTAPVLELLTQTAAES